MELSKQERLVLVHLLLELINIDLIVSDNEHNYLIQILNQFHVTQQEFDAAIDIDLQYCLDCLKDSSKETRKSIFFILNKVIALDETPDDMLTKMFRKIAVGANLINSLK